MTITTIDQTTIDHRPHAEAEEHPGVVGRGSDAGGPALPEPVDERPMPRHARPPAQRAVHLTARWPASEPRGSARASGSGRTMRPSAMADEAVLLPLAQAAVHRFAAAADHGGERALGVADLGSGRPGPGWARAISVLARRPGRSEKARSAMWASALRRRPQITRSTASASCQLCSRSGRKSRRSKAEERAVGGGGGVGGARAAVEERDLAEDRAGAELGEEEGAASGVGIADPHGAGAHQHHRGAGVVHDEDRRAARQERACAAAMKRSRSTGRGGERGTSRAAPPRSPSGSPPSVRLPSSRARMLLLRRSSPPRRRPRRASCAPRAGPRRRGRAAASASSVAEIGRVRKIIGSPRERIMARRRCSSSSGPRTKPSRSGAGSQPSLTST